MNFIEVANHFVQDGFLVRTTSNVHTNDVINGRKLLLKEYKVMLVDGNTIVNIDHITQKNYTRTNVHILPVSFNDIFTMTNGKCRLLGAQVSAIINTALVSFTVNEKKLSLDEPQLLIGDIPKGDFKNLIENYKNYLRGVKDQAIVQELLDINIDMPQYGVVDDRLIILNEDDEFINRMMIYEKCKIKGKPAEVLSMYKFGQDLQTMQSHILNNYVMIVDREIKINVELDNDLKMIPNDDTVMMLPLKYSRYREYDMKSIVKMFNRGYEYGSYGKK